MVVLTVMLYAAVVIVSLLLIALVLVQPSKQGGLGAAFGGGLGESVFGAQAGSHLTKMTVVMTTIFFGLTLLLAVLVSRGDSQYQSATVNQALEKMDGKAVPAVETPAAEVPEVTPEAAPETVPANP
ncbi:preprotein translocase subunit SecG [Victivallis sp. Marseille-Q1083]|uniref:preprotein translocase subunit SecG n=1 Tax=Victivallis sp. Marseille-Q1083 TaxID=2717288 RepID=UPI00158A4565|nr:preprotein translocase subunit SecG [Victivallis sp. Marseille-Q1083]